MKMNKSQLTIDKQLPINKFQQKNLRFLVIGYWVLEIVC